MRLLPIARRLILMRRTLLAALLAAIATHAAHTQTGPYSLRGHLVDAQTGLPLADTQVRLADTHWQPVTGPVTSPADGSFAFTGLTAGEYLLEALYRGEAVYFREFAGGSVGEVRAGAAYENKEILFRVAALPVISGRVVDEHGHPVAGASVAAFSARWMYGSPRLEQRKFAQTNDLGEFRFSALWPGIYSVCAYPPQLQVGQPWQAADGPEVDFIASPEPRYYKRACDPAAPPAMSTVGWGEEKHVQLKLEPAAPIHVQGRVLNMERGLNVILEREPGVGSFAVTPSPDGAFDFTITEPGDYLLSSNVYDPSRPRSAHQQIHVDSAGLRGLQLELQPPTTVDVEYHYSAGPPPQRDSVLLFLQRAAWPPSLPFPPGAGTYYRPGEAPQLQADAGSYWLTGSTTGPYCIASAKLGDVDALRVPVEIPLDRALHMAVELTTSCGSVKAQAVTNGHAVPFAIAAVLISGSAESPGWITMEYADEDGRFTIDSLRPGRYSIWAWGQDDVSYPGPATLAEVAKQGIAFEVTAGARVDVTVPALQGGPRQ